MYITYDMKNGKEYAKIVTSHWKNGKDQKTYLNLGRVIDRDKGIFKNRQRGTFRYDINSNTYCDIDDIKDPSVPEKIGHTGILTFGDVWFLDNFIRKDGLYPAIQAIDPEKTDILMALISFYILRKLGLCHFQSWYEHSYLSVLYPGLKLDSQRISEILGSFGSEDKYRSFFKAYQPYLESLPGDMSRVIVDSTGLPNSIHFPLTAVNNHGGVISREVRMEFVVEQVSGVPVYLRIVQGAIPDVSTIVATSLEMKNLGFSISDILFDAGYFSEHNAAQLINGNVDFFCRLKENLTLYKDLFARHRHELVSDDNLFKYGNRAVFVKETTTIFKGEAEVNGKTVQVEKKVFVYVCLDIQREALENLKTLQNMGKNNLSETEIFEAYQTSGSFALFSTKKLQLIEVLPCYYVRQEVEQAFDITKNYTNCLPLRIESIEALRGHLLLTFIATTVVKRIQYILEFEQPKRNKKLNPISLLENLGYQEVRMYENMGVVQEADSVANQGYKVFKLNPPASINI